jgi:cold-inducible RNA-binding protein
MNSNLYIGNISFKLTDEDLKKAFSAAGKVGKVNIIKDRDTGRSRGYGFVEMEADDEKGVSAEDAAKNVISMFNGKDLEGRALRVAIAEERKPKRSFGDRPPRNDVNV